MTDRPISTSVIYNGKVVLFRRLDATKFVATRNKYHRQRDICPLCKQVIVPTATQVVLMISNRAGIPNRVMHGDCFDASMPEFVVRVLAEEYRKACKYRDWFDS